MVKRLKTMVLISTILLQFLGFIFLFIHIVVGASLFILHLLGWVALFALLIKERMDEKREEDENDYNKY